MYRRGDQLEREGDPARWLAFVTEGCFKYVSPRALRPADAALPWHCWAARLAGHRLVSALDLWSLCPAKNVTPKTISKIRKEITF